MILALEILSTKNLIERSSEGINSKETPSHEKKILGPFTAT